MDWNAVGAVGEILGAIAVFVTLIYLATQIRQNSKSLKAQTRSEITSNTNFLLQALMDDPIGEVFEKISAGDVLTDSERRKLSVFMRWQYRNAENVSYQYRMGNFDADEFQGYQHFFLKSFKQPHAKEFWEQNRLDFSIAFQKEIDDLWKDPDQI